MPRTRPHLATFALLLGTFLASLDVNVVGTAMPTVVSQLGGLKLYGLVFAGYLLTSTTTIPLYGRLADLYGRKPMYLAAAALFLVGSGLCGAAGSMEGLIVFRLIQGLGAGGLIPLTITLFGDLYEARQRAIVQGLFSTVWGVSSVLGPLVGGFFVTYVTWRWAFWVNLPAGLVAAAILAVTLFEQREGRARGKLNVPGALTLTACLAALLAGLQALEQSAGPGLAAGLLAGAGLLAALLVLMERRSSQPLLPLDVFEVRAMRVTTATGLVQGALLFGTLTFIPLYVQGVLHGTPTQAGLALVPLSLVWTASTFVCGPLYRRLGYRPVVILGGALLAVGSAGLSLSTDAAVRWLINLFMAVTGGGMGLTITSMTVAVQDEMTWQRRGLATSLMQFSRTLGGMITVTVLGSVITASFGDAMGPLLPADTTPAELLDPSSWGAMEPAVVERARAALARAIRAAFWTGAGAGLLMLLGTLAFPRLHVREGGKG